MASRWYRIPETGTGSGTDPYRPDYLDSMGLSYSGNKSHPNGPPAWVVRVYGTTSELDTLTGKTGVTELSGVPTDALNQMFGQSRTATEWENGFEV